MNAFTTSDGLRIAYRRSGTGPALVLLHGFIADGRVWRTQIDDFSRDFDVIAWDAPGCGQSCDTPEDFSMQEYARCLLALLNDADVEAPHLLGLSWGGTLALEFHRLFPQHVRSMIIADSYAGWTGSLGAEAAQARLDRCLRESQLPAADWVPQWVPGAFSAGAPQKVLDELASIMWDFHPLGFRAMSRAVHPDFSEALSGISVPALLIWGADDARSPLPSGDDADGRRIHRVRGANQQAHIEMVISVGLTTTCWVRARHRVRGSRPGSRGPGGRRSWLSPKVRTRSSRARRSSRWSSGLVVTAERRYAPTVMTPSPVPGAAVTQFAVIDALLAGAYESGLRVAEARSIGNFGLGCVDHLGGEVVIVDGEAIECTLDGPPVAMDDDNILPFAIVCRFPDVPRVGLREQDFAGFAVSVEDVLTSRNLFHAVRFDGVLSEVRVRVTPRAHAGRVRPAATTSDDVDKIADDWQGCRPACNRRDALGRHDLFCWQHVRGTCHGSP